MKNVNRNTVTNSFGSRLKRARTSQGLSLRDLSAQMERRVSAQALGKYERGEMQPSPEVRESLARTLDIQETYFDVAERLSLISIDFRKEHGVSHKEETQLRSKVLDRVSRYLQIEEALLVKRPHWVQPAGFPFEVHEPAEAELAATLLRDQWQMGSAPVWKLADLLEHWGMRVVLIDGPDTFSGLAANIRDSQGGDLVAIFVNKDHSGERQRFTIAHELAHIVLRAGKEMDIEKACHRFAGAFLLPSHVARNEFGDRRSHVAWAELFRLKGIFGLSVQAIVYRLKDLQIIGESTYKALFQEMAARGWRTKTGEPNGLPPEQSERIARHCIRAVAEGVLNESAVKELLGAEYATMGRLPDYQPLQSAAYS